MGNGRANLPWGHSPTFPQQPANYRRSVHLRYSRRLRKPVYQSVISCRGGLRSPDSLWTTSQFRNIHHESSNQWPDVIHGLEIQSSRTMLQPFIRNLWRTVWCSQAAKRELNSRHLRTYAISFELMPPVKSFGMGTMKRFGDLFRRTLPLTGSTAELVEAAPDSDE